MEHRNKLRAWKRTFKELWKHFPFTITLLGILLVVGFLTQALWHPAEEQPWYQSVAYGLPAMQQGVWWAPVSGLFLVSTPLEYIPTILGVLGVALLENQVGWQKTIFWFVSGHVFAVIASDLFIIGLSPLDWQWSSELAQQLDVGPSAGQLACLGVAASKLSSPWRHRIWLILATFTGITFLFVGDLADVIHAFSVLFAALTIRRSDRVTPLSAREKRLCTALVLLGLVAVDAVTALVTTSGPFGTSTTSRALIGPILVEILLVTLTAHSLLRGRRWAWWCTVILTAVNTLLLPLYFVLLTNEKTHLIPEIPRYATALASSAALGILWSLFLVWLILNRGTFRTSPPRTFGDKTTLRPDDVLSYVQSGGDNSFAWMSTWPGFDYYVSDDNLITFQRHLGVAIALGSPIGPATGAVQAARDFALKADKHRLTPCFFGVSERFRAELEPDWIAIPIATDTVIDLREFSLQGSSRTRLRQALSRADRSGERFEMSRWIDLSFPAKRQIEGISETWLDNKDLPELKFTLGTLTEAQSPHVRVAVARSSLGAVEGFLSWLPVYSDSHEVVGWTLDLMRHGTTEFPLLMEFLVVSSLLEFAAEGAQWVSLSAAPLAVESEHDDALTAAIGVLSNLLEPVYGFRSLLRFKDKFRPRHDALYLMCRDEADLPRIAAGLTRAFLPDASATEYAGFVRALRVARQGKESPTRASS